MRVAPLTQVYLDRHDHQVSTWPGIAEACFEPVTYATREAGSQITPKIGLRAMGATARCHRTGL
jgi:hypothetical protein